MISFIARRLGGGLVLMLGISFIAFVLVFAGGQHAAHSILGQDADAAAIAAKEAELGLDQPFLAQYWNWLSHALMGDFGRSWFNSETVTDLVSSRLPVTLSIVSVAILLTGIVSVLLGMTAAVRGGWLDRVIQVISVIGVALPNFWVAVVLVLIFAVGLSLLPATGYVPFADSPSRWLASITLPVAALLIAGIASTAQQIRGATIDVLGRDFVRTLRSRGLSDRSVLVKHVLRASAGPALTVLSLQFIGTLGGAVVIEKVFALPGLGLLGVNSTIKGDMPVIMGVLITTAVIVVIVNLVIDIVNGWINPKARIA
ncbi:MAG: ABC transporter permease [Microbacterium sp.]